LLAPPTPEEKAIIAQGGQVQPMTFKRMLVNQCQQEFERGSEDTKKVEGLTEEQAVEQRRKGVWLV
jgi:hypothetical protein